MRSQRSGLPLLLGLAAVVLGVDLATKVLAVSQLQFRDPVPVMGDFVHLHLLRNPGAAFSLATGMTWVLTLIAIGIVVGVLKLGTKLQSAQWAFGLGLILGGAFGNLIDRIFRSPGPMRGHVIDFIEIGWWPVFNVADSAIVCGAALLVLLMVLGYETDGSRTRSDK